MILKPDFKFITFEKDGTIFKFLETGDIFEILSNEIMINMFNGTEKEGSLNNIYLRLYKKDLVKAIPLLGVKSNSKIFYDENSILFEGVEEDLNYKIRFTLLNKNIWFYEIDVYGNDYEFDILYCQDISIANKKACITNELYTSQYIDHKILESENGYVVCSRQNQDQNGKFPYVEHGCLNSKIISYSTDQMQFFSQEYKLTDVPFLLDKNLSKENYQFELSYVAMQTEKMKLNKHKNVVFYGLFKENYDTSIKNLKYFHEVRNYFEELRNVKNNFKELNRVKIKNEFGTSLSSEKFSKSEIDEIYKLKKFEEYKEGELLSFFTENHSHVVLQEKELLCERPHGNIIINGIYKDRLSTEIISSTNYMFGVFNAQIVLGNTSLNKMISVNRGLLNVLKNTGQRIYIKIDEKFRLLTLAGIYEMGLNFSKWYYKIKDDILIIKTYTLFDSPKIFLEVESQNNIKYEFIITNQLVMGENEFENSCNVSSSGDSIKIEPQLNSFFKNTYPNIFYELSLSNCKFDLSDDRVFFEDNVSRNKTLMTLKIYSTKDFKLSISGSFENEVNKSITSFDEEREKFNNFYFDLVNGFKIESENSKYDLDKLNEIIYFYAHNALIHFASPHGLEQSGGAAWGTRDVCQGAIEFFMATNNYKIVREIILKVFSHQFKETGEWPQWFMFDKYNMQQDDSHGDIIFWPIKVISEYVLVTGDKSIFNEKCCYRSFPNCEITSDETIFEHIKRAIDSIKGRFIKETYLISYEGGDWDDTLQPINDLLKQRLISTWTMALAYESIKKLYEVIDVKELKSELEHIFHGIKKDFLNFAIKNNVISGFIYLDENENIEYIIHPLDFKTGINYRLLPLIRSIISEMVDLNQAEINEKLIEEHLTFNDGVRLMNNTPKYNGGISKIFKRAERASNVGREISLQYVHAHIRFIEAMCKLSKAEKVWDALFKINPIKIDESVKNASYRQSNCYFSSSDGDFKTRYDFQENFFKLKKGNVNVKSGWRIYSSGPGIYINQIITNVLGIREMSDRVIFDPIIPKSFNDLKLKYKILNKDVKIIYKLNGGTRIEKIILNGEEIETINEENIYRNNFKSISKSILKDELKNKENTIEIIMI